MRVEGHPDRVNSFTACLDAVLLDRSPGYTALAGTTGAVFSPAYDPDEDCTAWWMESGDAIHLDIAGKMLGFRAERIVRRDGEEDRYLESLRNAIKEEKRVIVRSWPSWSILTGWSEKPDELPFTTVKGFGKAVSTYWPPHRSTLAYVISVTDPGEYRFSDVLQIAAEVAGGDFQNGSIRYGGELYGAASRRAKEPFFCPSCRENDASCAHRTITRIAHLAETASEYLQREIDRSPDARSSERNGDIADRYRSMFSKLRPYAEPERFTENWTNGSVRTDIVDVFDELAADHNEIARLFR